MLDWKLTKAKILDRKSVAKLLALVHKQSLHDYTFLAIAGNLAFRLTEVVHLKVAGVNGDEIIVQRAKKRTLVDDPMPLVPAVAKLLVAWVKTLPAGSLWLFPGNTGTHDITRTPKAKTVVVGTCPGGKGCKHGVGVAHDITNTTKATKIVIGRCPGGHICRREIQSRWRGYLETLGLYVPGRGIHSLRHYAVTEFYTRHRDLRATQEFVKHSSSAITENYAHVVDMKEKINDVEPTL